MKFFLIMFASLTVLACGGGGGSAQAPASNSNSNTTNSTQQFGNATLGSAKFSQ
jgi:hypothetical protein